MAAYRRVYDSRRLQAGISSGTLRSVIEYGLPLPLLFNVVGVTSSEDFQYECEVICHCSATFRTSLELELDAGILP